MLRRLPAASSGTCTSGMAFPGDPWLFSAGAAVAVLKFLSNLIRCLLVIDRL